MNRSLLHLLLFLIGFFSVSLPVAGQSKSEGTRDTLGVQLGEASVKATRLLFVTKKDTVVFDLDALVNEHGASLGDALQKLPGMEMRQGVLYFNGKRVDRLMVNGIDFSRENPQLALSNLPAYIVKHIKAYERKSDMAMVTGIDDGVRNQVVDVILRREYNGTWTGQGTAGMGTHNTAKFHGFANTFTDRFRITLFGNANNLNQPLWYSGEGHMQAYYVGYGRSTYRSPGASFFWKTNKEEGKRGYFIIEVSGDYNNDCFRKFERNNRENYLQSGNTYSADQHRQRGGEIRWVAHPSLKWSPTDWTFIQYNSDVYTSKVNKHNRRAGAIWNINPFHHGSHALDSLLLHPEGWPNAQDIVTRTQTEAKEEVNSNRYNHNLYFTQRLSESNWRLSLRNQVNLYNDHHRNFSINDYHYYQSAEKPHELLNRYVWGERNSRGQMTFLDLHIPVVKNVFLRTTYGYTTSRDKGQDEGYLLNRLGAPYDDYATATPLLGLLPGAQTQWQAAVREAETTRFTRSNERKHWAELYGQYSHNGWYFQTQATLRFAHETLDYEKMEYAPINRQRNFRDGNISSLLKYEHDSIGRFELEYAYGRSAPQYLSMITIPDYSNPLNITLGNPDLKHKQDHQFTFNYHKTNADTKGRLFSFLRTTAVVNFSANEGIQAQTYDRTTGVTTTMPINVSGNYTTHFMASMGLPWRKTFSGELTLRYFTTRSKGAETASDLSQLKLMTTDLHSLIWGASVTYRKGGCTLELPLYHAYAHYFSDYANVDGRSTNIVYIEPDFTWKLPAHFEVTASARMRWQSGYGADFTRRNRTDLWFRVSRSFLKSENLTVYVEGRDLLNHNDGFHTENNASSLTYSYAESLGRYMMIGMIYRFSTKKQRTGH